MISSKPFKGVLRPMMRKLMPCLSVLLIVGLVLAQSALAKKTISFWVPATGEVFDTYKEAVEVFNSKSEDFQVNVVGVPDMARKLLVAVAGGTPPDVVAHWDPGSLREWVERDSLLPLTPFIKSDKYDLSTYVPKCLEQVTFYDQLWGLPLTSSLKPVFFWNKDLFKEAGLNPEVGPKSWNELVAFSDKLTIKEGNRIKRIGFTPLWAHINREAFPIFFVQNGVQLASKDGNKVIGYINTPKAVEALEFVADLANRYGREAYQSFSSQFGSGIQDPFLTGRIAMAGGSSPMAVRGILYFKPDFKLGYSLLPTPTGKDHITFTYGSCIVIPKGSKHPKEAWEFAKWYSGPDQTILSEKVGYNAGNLVALERTKHVISSKIVLSYYKSIVHIPQTPVQGIYLDEIIKARDEVIYGRKSAKQALDDFARKIQAEIDKFVVKK